MTKAAPGGMRGIRTGLIGGSSVPPELVERLDELGTRVLNVYGMTEIGAASCCRLDDSAEVRYATSGRPLPGYELRVERELSAGAGGELFVRGDSVTPGYLGRPDQTAESFVDGWLRTGDLAFFVDEML